MERAARAAGHRLAAPLLVAVLLLAGVAYAASPAASPGTPAAAPQAGSRAAATALASLGTAAGAPARAAQAEPSGSVSASPPPSTRQPAASSTPPAGRTSATLLVERAVGAIGPQGGDATGFEPIVATHPTDPETMAVAYQRYGGAGSRCGLLAGIRISHDGGRSWTEVPRHPWDGSARSPSFHSAIAWGPGPSTGSARLYWIDTTVPGCDYSRHQVAVSFSDDEGRSWAPLQVQAATPPWIGGFPDISVDRDPRSPGFGTVYAVYNWPGSPQARGPGLRLLVSRDFGRSWRATEVGPARSPAGYPVAWRLGYRVRPSTDGAYVSWFQADLRRWDPADFFDRGGVSNVGRAGFVVVHIRLDPASGGIAAGAPVVAVTVGRNGYTVGGWSAPGTLAHSYPDPTWSHGLDVDPDTGRVYLAIGDWAVAADAGRARGSVWIGASDDLGLTWRWATLPTLLIDGRPASPFKPSLAVAGGRAVVGMHWIADRPSGSAGVQAGEAYAAAAGGDGFGAPTAVPGARWPARALASAPNGPGLRDRIAATTDGRFVYAYGDGRVAEAHRSTSGPSVVFAAVITISRPGPPSWRS